MFDTYKNETYDGLIQSKLYAWLLTRADMHEGVALAG